MTPQACGRMPEIPELVKPEILTMRASGKTIAEIAEALGMDGDAGRAAIQNYCLTHFGKRDYRGIDIGYQPGKTKSYRRGMAP